MRSVNTKYISISNKFLEAPAPRASLEGTALGTYGAGASPEPPVGSRSGPLGWKRGRCGSAPARVPGGTLRSRLPACGGGGQPAVPPGLAAEARAGHWAGALPPLTRGRSKPRRPSLRRVVLRRRPLWRCRTRAACGPQRAGPPFANPRRSPWGPRASQKPQMPREGTRPRGWSAGSIAGE